MQTFNIHTDKDFENIIQELEKEKGKACVVMDFRGNLGDTATLEKKIKRLQMERMDFLLCKIDCENVWIEIRQERDYQVFFQLFLHNNQIKEEYEKSEFWFYIHMDDTEEIKSVDEQRLFYYFLISNKYGVDRFKFKVIFPKKDLVEESGRQWNNSNFYRTCSYSMFQLLENNYQGTIRLQNQLERGIAKGNVNKIGKILPVFTINSETLNILQKPVDKKMWEKIRSGINSEKKDMGQKLEDAFCTLCRRYLFGEHELVVALSRIRKLTFGSEQFFELVEGIPLIALLIFAEFDYFSRIEMLKRYKKKLKRSRIDVKDLLDDYQSKQSYQDYCMHMAMLNQGMNNKTLLTRHKMYHRGMTVEQVCDDIKKKNKICTHHIREVFKNYNLHTQVVTEVYEAVTMAEGILQLADNVVKHAGNGLMSMRIHCIDDKTIVQERYPSYFLDEENKILQKYFLEVKICDLSGTDIAQQFKLTHREFKESLNDEQKELFDCFQLKSFFSPTDKERELWDLFYEDSRNIVNHYGLQIFDSIIQSKGGFFIVTSGRQCYSSEVTVDETHLKELELPGTSYSILLPLDNRVSEDKNIYDSMLAYDIRNYLEKRNERRIQRFDFCYQRRLATKNKSEVYDVVCLQMKREMNDGSIGVIDMEKELNLEGVVKGMLLYLFKEKEKDVNKEIEVAFVNCKTYQIVEIVRLISLSYNKAGKNNRMKGIQIYIRGKNIGEEILFFGNTLAEVGNNIMKMACMRGILYDNFHAVDTLLKRR